MPGRLCPSGKTTGALVIQGLPKCRFFGVKAYPNRLECLGVDIADSHSTALSAKNIAVGVNMHTFGAKDRLSAV